MRRPLTRISVATLLMLRIEAPDEPVAKLPVDELAESIASEGLLQPLLVYREEPEKYLVKSGERRRLALLRLQAQGRLSDESVPCLLTTDAGIWKGVIEEVLRDELKLWEVGRALELLSDSGLTVRAIAARLRRSIGYVGNALALSRGLAPAVQKKLSTLPNYTLTTRQLFALAAVRDEFEDPNETEQQRRLDLLLALPKIRPKRERNGLSRTVVFNRFKSLSSPERTSRRRWSFEQKKTVSAVLDYLSGKTNRVMIRDE